MIGMVRLFVTVLAAGAASLPRPLTDDEATLVRLTYRDIVTKPIAGACLEPQTSGPSLFGIPAGNDRLSKPIYDADGNFVREQPAGRVLDLMPVFFGQPEERRKATAADMSQVDAAYRIMREKGSTEDASFMPRDLFRGIRRGDDLDRCRVVIYIGMPQIVGNVAFVDSGYRCKGRCGGGSVLAFVRENGRWKLVMHGGGWIG